MKKGPQAFFNSGRMPEKIILSGKAMESIKWEIVRLDDEGKLGLGVSLGSATLEGLTAITYSLLRASKKPIPDGPYDELIRAAVIAWKLVSQ